MFSADRKRSLGHSPLPPYSFVASTVRSRRPLPAAIHRPMTDSVTPSARGWPYVFELSTVNVKPSYDGHYRYLLTLLNVLTPQRALS